jgi:DNA-binding response OmpR family regulator
VNPEAGDRSKPMILIYSPDMNFCFSLSSFFQDRYDVITTTDPELLASLAAIRSTRLVVIDDEPSRPMIERLRDLRRVNHSLPLMMLYVYGPGGSDLDKTVRDYVDTVLYKPLNINEISSSIKELVGG